MRPTCPGNASACVALAQHAALRKGGMLQRASLLTARHCSRIPAYKQQQHWQLAQARGLCIQLTTLTRTAMQHSAPCHCYLVALLHHSLHGTTTSCRSSLRRQS